MTNRDVAGAFIDGAMAARGNNMYIDNGVLYSYGPHFPMALMRRGKVYYNIDKYSCTTSKHQSYLRYVLPDNAVPVNTAALNKLMAGGSVDVRYSKIASTPTVLAIVSSLVEIGFVPTEPGDWSRGAVYGTMPISIEWRREYKSNSRTANICAAIQSGGGMWIGIIEACRGKVVSRKIDMANAILA